MTDSSMNFGPDWIRNLRSEGTTGGGTSTGTRNNYQLAEHRYGREEMLALFDKHFKPPASLAFFKTLFSESPLTPLALLPTTEEERAWQTRPTTIGGPSRGRGGSLERGGSRGRGRGSYQPYGRATSAYDSGWGNGEQPDWSLRKDFNPRNSQLDNWRRVRAGTEDDDGWRNMNSGRSNQEKWVRSSSWRGDGDSEERNGPVDRGNRPNWHDLSRGPGRKSWDNEDHLPEWANENPAEGGGTFDERGAFHGSDDEQGDIRGSNRKETLHKSTSQQHIGSKVLHPALSSSKSAISLTKPEESDRFIENPEERDNGEEFKTKENTSPEKERPKPTIDKEGPETLKYEMHLSSLANKLTTSNGQSYDLPTTYSDREDDFTRLHEALVLKLVVDEEQPKPPQTTTSFDVGNVQPPPNLAPPSQEKWYYQDPQGTRQGPFFNVEMAEWYKAGYFSNQLHVMRDCDERFFLLGELINLCGGDNPFLAGIRFPVLKNDNAKVPEDHLPYQLAQLAFKQQISMRNLAEPWGALTLQQQETAQRLMLHQQPMPDLQFMQQSTPSNPLMFMINQMQQSNKLPGPVLVDKPNNSVPNQLDPLRMQLGGIHSLQNRLHNQMPGGLPTNLSSSIPSEGLTGGLSNLQQATLSNPAMSSIPGLQTNLPSNLNRPTSHTSIDQLPPGQDNDPISNFLKQFHQQQKQRSQIPLDSLWQKQNEFIGINQSAQPITQWPQQPEVPLSMWDMQSSSLPANSMTTDTQAVPILEKSNQQPTLEKEQKPKEEISQKELKKKKELEEKQAKKDAEEKRKHEQRKQEAEKKLAEEKRRREEEKIRKELEKAKKEAEDKRLRELEVKRRMKEIRKAEEEARKKSEEQKKLEEDKIKREIKEQEEKKQAEAARLAQNQALRASKTAPWSQSNSSQGMSLSDIQKAEKEKRAQEAAALLLKQQHLQEQHHQQQAEKATGLQLSWAKNPVEPRKVKSFAEIQAEEQERLAKLTAEARLAAQQKEKEAPVAVNTGNIWNGQSLTWASASSTSQWSTNSVGGFWDDGPTKPVNKPSTVSKSNSTSAMTSTVKQPPAPKQAKIKSKKEEPSKSVNNNNHSANDEFTTWCYKTLSTISANVDIPTFVSFLRDIESAYDVRDYCKEYLGENPATQQFATNFLEKRRSFKPKNNAHKDDMCMPAPAITPSVQHSTEFQEVKGKNKKNKKSRMLKVDNRILGFNVTSAPDRINVGDRDYGDNS